MRPLLFVIVFGGALLLGSAPRPANGYEFIGGVWPAEWMPIPYCVNADNIPIGAGDVPVLSPEGFAARVRAAFQTWEDLPDSSITFAYQGFCSNSPWEYSDYVNTIGWDWLWGGVAGLAHTGPQGDGARIRGDFGQIYEVDVVIDTRLAQSFDDVGYYVDVVLPHILVHEIGHFIGLGHSREACSVMAPSGLKPGLCDDDIQAMRVLYPPR